MADSPSSTQLIRYEAMCSAIAAAAAVDEVKDIRDKAVAFAHYARQARNLEAERKCVEIRIRAERRAGELLKQMEKAKGSSGNQHTGPLDRHEGPKTLSDLGVSYDQSASWQRLANVPEEIFETALSAQDMPSTGRILQAAALADLVSRVQQKIDEPQTVALRVAHDNSPTREIELQSGASEFTTLRALERNLTAIINRYGANEELIDVLRLVRNAKTRVAEMIEEAQHLTPQIFPLNGDRDRQCPI